MGRSVILCFVRLDEPTLGLSPERGARAVALGLLAEAKAASDALAAGAGEEPLHDFRVALRRLRSALRTFRPWLAGKVPRRREKKLRRIARSTNEARDAEVQLAWLGARAEAFAAARHRPGYERLVARFEARAHGGPDAARVAVRFRRAAGKLGRKLAAGGREAGRAGAGPTFGDALASLVREEVDALSARMQAIRTPADEEAVHRARIEGKRLRYLLEPLRGYGPADASGPIGRLKRLQDLLGELHDAHVLAAEVREALEGAAAEQARRLHAAAYAPGAGARAIRDASRERPRAGLVAILRLVRERRDALYEELERTSRAGMDALAAEARAVAAALQARPGGRDALAGSADGPAAEAPLRRAAPRSAPRPPRPRGRSRPRATRGPRRPSANRR